MRCQSLAWPWAAWPEHLGRSMVAGASLDLDGWAWQMIFRYFSDRLVDWLDGWLVG